MANHSNPIQYPALSKHRGGNNGKSNQCTSAASCGAARIAVTRREVRPSDFTDRVAKWFRNIPERKTSNPNYLGSVTAENGAGAKGEMGKGEGGIEGSDGLGSCEAHHVGIRPQEDRGGTAGTLGEGEGGSEEGGIIERESAAQVAGFADSASCQNVLLRSLCCQPRIMFGSGSFQLKSSKIFCTTAMAASSADARNSATS
jgi:hypothetical protein